jgi:hypothetical protein
MQVTEIRERFPGVPEGQTFLVASRAALTAATSPESLPTTSLYLRAPEAALPAIASAVREQAPGAIVEAQGPPYRLIHDAPLVSLVDSALLLTLVVGSMFAVAATVSSVLLTSPRRARDLGYLATMGLSRRQGLAISLAEQLPPMAMAAAIGGLTGFAGARLLVPSLDLTYFTGSESPPVVGADPAAIAWVTLGVVAVLVTTVLLVRVRGTDGDLATQVRLGDAT